MKSRHPRYIALNLEISAMEQKLYSIYDDLKKTNEFPSLEMIKQVFRKKVKPGRLVIGNKMNLVTIVGKGLT